MPSRTTSAIQRHADGGTFRVANTYAWSDGGTFDHSSHEVTCLTCGDSWHSDYSYEAPEIDHDSGGCLRWPHVAAAAARALVGLTGNVAHQITATDPSGRLVTITFTDPQEVSHDHDNEPF